MKISRELERTIVLSAIDSYPPRYTGGRVRWARGYRYGEIDGLLFRRARSKCVSHAIFHMHANRNEMSVDSSFSIIQNIIAQNEHDGFVVAGTFHSHPYCVSQNNTRGNVREEHIKYVLNESSASSPSTNDISWYRLFHQRFGNNKNYNFFHIILAMNFVSGLNAVDRRVIFNSKNKFCSKIGNYTYVMSSYRSSLINGQFNLESDKDFDFEKQL